MQPNKPRFISSHEDLEVYTIAFDAAMEIFELSKNFPKEEKYSLIDQIRRSSRSVCANLAEAWTKGLPACRRRYKGSFLSKLNDAEAEEAETQVWLKFAVKCQYLDLDMGRELYSQYNQILGLKDFINKYSIALKEANETLYWIKIMIKSELVSKTRFQKMIEENERIIKILTASINKLKEK